MQREENLYEESFIYHFCTRYDFLAYAHFPCGRPYRQ